MDPRPTPRHPSRALVMAGVCHRTAPLDARQQRALDPDGARSALRAVRMGGVAREALALSTCNRVELYAAGDDPAALERRLRATLGAGRLTTIRHGTDAAHHVFRVAAGLESRVPGDDGIRGQLRDAARLARQAGATGIVLNRLVDVSLLAGRRVRAARAPVLRPPSVAACAVEVARTRLGPLTGRSALVIGARGATGREVARRLTDAGARVTSAGRAETADEGVLTCLLAAAELVVSATSATAPVVGSLALRTALGPAGMLVLDLGVPRDVDPAGADLPGLTLLDVDAVTAGAIAGGTADDGADRAVAGAADEWMAWWSAAHAGPAIAAMRAEEEECLRRAVDALPAAERERAWREGRRSLGALLHHRTLELRARVSPA
jgi:glutamyl-tRNA reductase